MRLGYKHPTFRMRSERSNSLRRRRGVYQHYSDIHKGEKNMTSSFIKLSSLNGYPEIFQFFLKRPHEIERSLKHYDDVQTDKPILPIYTSQDRLFFKGHNIK